MKKHIIHALRTHAKRTLAAAFAAAFALGSALTLSACSGKPAKQTGSNSTLVPQTEVPTVSATATPAPAETSAPFIDPNNHAENVAHEVYGSVVSGHVKLVNFENFHSTVDNSTNCISAYTSSHHECAPAMWAAGEGFHAFDNPAACAYTEENPVFVVIELSRLYEDSASLSKRVAESIRFE